MHDLRPATDLLTRVVGGIADDQLGAPTPCSETTVGALLAHVGGLCQAFVGAAAKTPLDAAPSADAGQLPSDWRELLPRRLAALGEAWQDEAAWTGMTAAGGVDLPGEVAGFVAIDEVVVHGWDLAVATGQDYPCPAEPVEAALGFVRPAAEENPQGTPGLFGPPVPVPRDAPLLDQLLGLTGRDPSWRPPG